MRFMVILCSLMMGAAILSSCSRAYDPATCARISQKIETQKPLSQDDYADMIAQNEYILDYLIERSSDGDEAQRNALHEDKEFLERFGYMLTFSSVLYRAHLAGDLSEENRADYEALDRSTTRYARLCQGF